MEHNLEVLVYTNVRKDADLTVDILRNAGFKSRVVTELKLLSDEISRAGALVYSEEALTKELLEELKASIETQPPWSDLPIITVTSGGSLSTESNERLQWIAQYLRNVTLLERPIRLATLITIVRTALSSRKKQFELKDLLGDLQESKRLADQANQAKSSFLANMSHEIRTPLAAIVGFTSLMRDKSLPVEERLQFADIIARNGDQLSSLVNDVLDLSKVEAGKLEIENVEMQFGSFVSDLSGLLRPMVERKGLKFAVEKKSKLPDFVTTDATRIRQVVLNLVSNAVKFTEKGSVIISIRSELLGDQNTRIVFDVVDSGIGMSSEDKSRIFKPFSQGDPSTTRKYGGTGLGLALSRALANAMGGDIRLVSSEPLRGSQFEFSFVAGVVDKSKVVIQKPIVCENTLEGMRILLVEDSLDNQFLMKRYLSGAGAQVVIADNGRSAIEFALSQYFDVVLMDIQMPILDGLSATIELRQRNYTGPIIALTAHALREERDRSLKAGCDHHLIKPISRVDLVEAVAAYQCEVQFIEPENVEVSIHCKN